jgi:DNA-binding PadR family transcriptional regulator
MSFKPNAVQWVILQMVETMPQRGDDYSLERFFRSTTAWSSHITELKVLVAHGFLQVVGPKASVKKYELTEAGRQLLKDGYSFHAMKDEFLSMDERGFVFGVMERIDEL